MRKTMSPAKLFVTQLLPLIVFLIVDALVTDTRISILAAISFAAGQLAFTYARTRRFDWFVLLDVGLIVGFGAVSIASANDLFFKIKPAVVEAVTVVFMLVLVVAPERLLIGYFGRMMPDGDLDPGAVRMMKSILGWMSLFTAVHIAAVLYTAFFSSKQLWAIVSGPGFYVIFIPIMGITLGKSWLARRRAATAASRAEPKPAAPRGRDKSRKLDGQAGIRGQS